MSKVLTFLFALLWTLNAHAQMGKLFDADKQMSSSFTTQVYLDRDGFIWVATRNGLNRYDGYQFQTLKKEKGKDLGMASNYVNCMMQDRNGLFYIGMYGAFQTYDGQHFHDIKTFDLNGHEQPHYITCLLERQNGDILVGTSAHGLLKMTNKDEAHQVGGVLKDLNTIHHMMEDSKQRIWMATDGQGLLCYDGKTVKRYFQDHNQINTVLDVCEDDKGHIYFGTTNAGLFRLDGETPVHIEGTGNKHISTLYFNRRGHIMLGCDGTGLTIYNPLNGRVVDNPYYSREVDLSKSKVYSICEDQVGNVWLGLLQKGVYMHPATTMGFGYMGYKLGSRNILSTASVTSVLGATNGYIWVGTDKDGLYAMDTSYKVIKHFDDNFPSTILGLCEDNQQRIWIGSYREGCGWIDPKSMTYHPYPLPQGTTCSIFDLICNKKGQLWLATMGEGLLRIDLATNEMKAYKMAEDAPQKSDINTITNDYISQIAFSSDGRRLYVATTMGVCALDIEKESWTSVFGKNCLNYGTPTRIAREYDGVLYIGTNDGLLGYDLKTRKIHVYGIETGLADNGIASIEQDSMRRLWISTDHGLCCLDPKTGKTSNYFVDNGLQSNEFSDGASFKTSDGRLVFGGLAGVTWFYPKDIKEREWKAEVKLTGFSVNGVPVTPGTMSGFWKITDSPVISSERFVLSPGDNTFALQLSTLTYDNPEHIVYCYRINKEEWVRMQPGVNEITFSHLPPGDYHFCVVAEQNGISTPERCFTVVIHAPWYRTPLAYLIYLLILLGLFLWYRKQRHRKEQDRLRLQEHIHAEEMADAKLKFFMNISHEVRTPMTLIVAPLLSLIKQDDDPHRRSVYETIRRNAERILGLINQMMDLRKIDKGQMQMHMCETEMISFVGDIYTLFTQQAKSKTIQFTYEHDTQELPVWIDRNNFDKVIMNLLSNAFKFTPTGGNIRIGITHDDSQVRIAIKDSGEGIPEDKLERIFERFYQTPSHANDRKTGTGIGLDLTRSLVELHHGTIEARNNTDSKGAEFIVTIPLGNAHLKPEEMLTEAPSETQVANIMDEEILSESPVIVDLPKAGRRQCIIIVEDDTEIRDYLSSELSTDYDIIACDNGKSGLTEVLKNIPDLVISDVMMPEMDGNTMCSKIKQNPTTSHVPVILLTAKSRDEDQLEGLEMGADAYILKPFNLEILRRTIVNLIHTHQMLRLKYGRNDQLEEQVDDVKMKSPDDQLLERVMKVINKNISNSDLSVDGIADEVGISRVHLHRKMKELTGQTPHDFIRNIRLKQAANLLASRNMNITEVMYACGFNNAASFSTIFKKFYGMSPREYMNEHQKKNKSL
jgi:signal transduction histidine kinase/ligand-binding sensor domain-containing protein/DNA-binding response OmpR family regulator